MEKETPDTFALVYALATRVMRWYGFADEFFYTMLPAATEVAVEVVKRKVTPGIATAELRVALDRMTRQELEAADAATGSKLRLMWEACNASTYVFAPVASAGE